MVKDTQFVSQYIGKYNTLTSCMFDITFGDNKITKVEMPNNFAAKHR